MNYYVTSSIPYVNGDPHIGHALEFVMADVLARAARKKGYDVLFSTGTDEHGDKIAIKAHELKKTPQALSDEKSLLFRNLAKSLNISNDRFIRTTDDGHEERAKIIWKALEKDIYKSKYIGLYCTGCEEFVPENVAKENKNICPNHKIEYQRLEEENYFFKLSGYSDQIRAAILAGSLEVIPMRRRNEIMSLINEGLEDISISRPKKKLSWGIPVPGDSSQVMYVWPDALMNYITVLGYPEHADFKKFWPANVQVIGKDILRFHAAIWPGMLLALGLPLPEKLYVHGFINIENKKMSKSLGNVVSPDEIISKYSADVFRYFVLRHIPSYDDGDFSWEAIERAYNTELANELGNAVQRTASMISNYQDGIIGDTPEANHDASGYWEAIEKCKFDRALDIIWDMIRGVNQYIEQEKPWEIAKLGDNEHLQEVLASQVSDLIQIADLLEPFLPETAGRIKHVFEDGVIRPIKETLFPRLDAKPKKATK